MLSFLPGFILLPISFSLFVLNLAFWGLVVTPLGIVKLLLPFRTAHRLIARIGRRCYRGWTAVNTLLIQLFNRVDWQINPAAQLKPENWYLLIANHKSWLDIPVVSTFAYNVIPEPKFFLKDQLKWIPFLGSGCWALDMPYMKRYSAATLAKYPHLKGQDIETTRRSCEKFRHTPTTIINFVEGSRCTEQKQKQRNSPFTHLLSPKAGGIAFTLASMGEQFDAILDVTLIYPDNQGNIALDMLMGRLKRVVITADIIPIDQHIIGDYFNNAQFRESFQHWLNNRWQYKDQQITDFYHQDLSQPSTENVTC